jgi:hypothetical protein
MFPDSGRRSESRMGSISVIRTPIPARNRTIKRIVFSFVSRTNRLDSSRLKVLLLF